MADDAQPAEHEPDADDREQPQHGPPSPALADGAPEPLADRHARDRRQGSPDGGQEDRRVGVHPEGAGREDANSVEPEEHHRDHADEQPVREVTAPDVGDELDADVGAAEEQPRGGADADHCGCRLDETALPGPLEAAR